MTSKALIDRMTEPLRETFKEAEIFMKTIVQGPPTGAPVTVTVAGDSFQSSLMSKKH